MTVSLPVPLPSADEPQALVEALAVNAARALGPAADAALSVERDRSLGDRLAGRPGTVTALRLEGVDARMTLRLERHRLTGEAAQVSGGVVIARRAMPLGAWLQAFAGEVAAVAADAAGDAAVAARALAALGVAPAADVVRVDPSDVAGGLLPLRAAVAGRVPEPAAAIVDRIATALQEALPRVTGTGEPEVVVTRTATDYLPETLRAYLALPAEWAAHHRLSDGRTPAEALVQQLTALEQAATQMRDAAVERDADALLVNGRFLDDRFRTSRLDLP
ncbi:hypothetical protein DEI92_04485 [Curtobacterium sp. MCBD17_034]|uniref:hypothetical protein n=1 Tax=unclassified Curtobacterium TaxID=257496 RepID=UPI000DA95E63|nr:MULTISPECIES: hypothetical protein [unclassified Curtobacterium]PZF60901.1 hypothetical protein DEI92_04485 [Curtobacterium sp. MCBD17_034]PZM40250.1 hypothetical protein DEI90_00720 [Curtobacterium sp. MCBD17_031]